MEKLFRVSIDFECNADHFWDMVDVSHCPVPRFGEWLNMFSGLPIILDLDEMQVITSWLKEQPGWNDPEYPDYAPHPLVILSV